MDYKYIDQLLQRYWNAETTLEEEEILRAFFCQKDLPAEFMQYRPLFAYEHAEKSVDRLGSDFDAKLLQAIQSEEEPMIGRKARRATLSQRLMPLFRAAAIVAITLTLGNAIQASFGSDEEPLAATEPTETGVSVAVTTDSVPTIEATTPEPTPINN